MTQKVSRTKSPITMRHVLTTAVVLLVFALVFVAPATADVIEVSNQNELETAISSTALKDGDTIKLGTGTFTLSSLTDKKITFNGTKDSVISITSEVGGQSSTFTFENITIKYGDTATYTGIAHTTKVEYKNCTITGQMFLYGSEVDFTDCTFINKDNAYSVWTYGAEKVTFTNCIFESGGKAVLVYNEAYNINFVADIILNNCTFNDHGDLDTAKGAVETGVREDKPIENIDNKYYITFISCKVNGFAANTEGKPADERFPTFCGNKRNMDADHLIVTFKQTIKWLDEDGTTNVYDPTYVVYGDSVEKPEDPTKVGYLFGGWNPVVSDADLQNVVEDKTFTAQWETRDLGNVFTYSFGEPSTGELTPGEVTIPINFKTTNAEKIPTSWEIAVTVKNVDTDVTDALTYSLTGNSEYITEQINPDGASKNVFGVTADYGVNSAASPVNTNTDGLFTLTITGLPTDLTIIDYTVTAEVRTNVGIHGEVARWSDATTDPAKLVAWIIPGTWQSNIYADDSLGKETPWNTTNKVKVTFDVINKNKDQYTSTLSDILVKRGDYPLNLTTSGKVTITKVTTAGEEKPAASGTKLVADGEFVSMKIAAADKADAKYFKIVFDGNKVGDVEYTDELDHIDVLDKDYILHQSVMPTGDVYLSNANYLVYANVDHADGIDSDDARIAFVTGSHMTLSADDEALVLMYKNPQTP